MDPYPRGIVLNPFRSTSSRPWLVALFALVVLMAMLPAFRADAAPPAYEVTWTGGPTEVSPGSINTFTGSLTRSVSEKQKPVGKKSVAIYYVDIAVVGIDDDGNPIFGQVLGPLAGTATASRDGTFSATFEFNFVPFGPSPCERGLKAFASTSHDQTVESDVRVVRKAVGCDF